MPSNKTDAQERVLRLLADWRLLTVDMLVSLVPFTHYKRGQETLKKMTDRKWVEHTWTKDPFGKRTKPVHAYALTKKGIQQLQEITGIMSNAPPPPKDFNMQAPHLLAVNVWRMCIEQACRQKDGVELGALIPDYYGRAAPSGGPPMRQGQAHVWVESLGENRLFVPDMVVVLSRGTHKGLYFVEVDRGSEPTKTLVEKVRTYDAYWSSRGFGHYAEQYGYPFVGFYVLFIASAPCIKRLFSALVETDMDTGFVWATEDEALTSGRFFQSIWQVAGRNPDDRYALIPS